MHIYMYMWINKNTIEDSRVDGSERTWYVVRGGNVRVCHVYLQPIDLESACMNETYQTNEYLCHTYE